MKKVDINSLEEEDLLMQEVAMLSQYFISFSFFEEFSFFYLFHSSFSGRDEIPDIAVASELERLEKELQRTEIELMLSP